MGNRAGIGGPTVNQVTNYVIYSLTVGILNTLITRHFIIDEMPDSKILHHTKSYPKNAHDNVHRLQRLPFSVYQDRLTSSSELSDCYVGYHASSMECLPVKLPTTHSMCSSRANVLFS